MSYPEDSSRSLEVYQKTPTLMAGEHPGGGGSVRVWAPDRNLIRRVVLGPLQPAGLKYLAYWTPRLIYDLHPALLIRWLVRLSLLLLHRVWIPGIEAALLLLIWLGAYAEIRYCLILGTALGYLFSSKRRNFIAADDVGIAFRGSSCADLQTLIPKFEPEYFPWAEIVALHHTMYIGGATGWLTLETSSDRSIRVVLNGYSYQTRQEICELIAERAGLQITRPSRRVRLPIGTMCTPGHYLRPGWRYRPLLARSKPAKSLPATEPPALLAPASSPGRYDPRIREE